MTAHAVLSASGAHRWLNCTPSAVLEVGKPDTSSEAAREGTAAHALAEHKLRRALKQRSRKPRSKYIGDDMEEHTDNYVTFIQDTLSDLADPLVMIEQRLDYSNLVEDGFGTGDCVIIAENNLHIVDLKYGQGVQVDAVNNPQMMLYALGALNEFGPLFDIVDVAMTIFQPRRGNISTFTLTTEELEAWGRDVVAPTALVAAKGEGEFNPGPWCQFCKLAPTCRARAAENLALAQLDFKDAPELTHKEMVEVLTQIPQLKAWAGAVEKYALTKALEGTRWEGFKLVAGRANRVYTDPDQVAQAAKAAGYEDIFDKKLIGITAMEKLMGKKEFTQILGDLVFKPAGKPTLVGDSDKRAALEISTAADDFKTVKETE